MDLCTIAFQPEAFDSAFAALQNIIGYTVTVVPNRNEQLSCFEPFDAELHDVIVGADGQYKAVLRPWDEERDEPSAAQIVWDIYDDIERIEVI